MDKHHEHYDHYDPTMIDRLDGFYGLVETSINESIRNYVIGSTVLDIGCGFGSLVNYLSQDNLTVVGIDQHEPSISAGRKKYPKEDLRLSSGVLEEFPDKSFDTIIMKDIIHHVHSEDDSKEFLAEVHRVCKKRLIIVDPNPTLIVKVCRKLIGHVDPVCAPDEATRLLRESRFTPKICEYSQSLAFPMSGGYVGRELIKSPSLQKKILKFDSFLTKSLRVMGMDKYICWRYLIAADV